MMVQYKQTTQISLFSLLCLMTISSTAQSNSIQGIVSLPFDGPPLIGRMMGYQDRNHLQQMQVSDVFVVAYPLSFRTGYSPMANAVITQKEETFIPGTLMVTPGTTVYFLNEDQQYHNVFSRTPGSAFNIGRRPPGHMYPQRIDRPGVVKLFCDIHARMRAYIICVETPYFGRLNADGSFFISGLPDGRYRIEVIHPQIRTYRTELSLQGGQNQMLNIDLSR